MPSFLRALGARTSLAILAVSGALALALGSVWWLAPGVALAAALAAGKALDPAARRRARLRSAPGIDEAVLGAVDALERRLAHLRERPSASGPADRGRIQLARAEDAYAAFTEVLARRFAPSELTFGRYLEAGRQVYLALLDGLGRAATELEAVADIDARGLRSALRQHERRGGDPPEAAALRARVTLYDEALGAAGKALTENDQALNELTAAASELARVETGRGLARAEGETVMAELQALVERAERYAIVPRRGD